MTVDELEAELHQAREKFIAAYAKFQESEETLHSVRLELERIRSFLGAKKADAAGKPF